MVLLPDPAFEVRPQYGQRDRTDTKHFVVEGRETEAVAEFPLRPSVHSAQFARAERGRRECAGQFSRWKHDFSLQHFVVVG